MSVAQQEQRKIVMENGWILKKVEEKLAGLAELDGFRPLAFRKRAGHFGRIGRRSNQRVDVKSVVIKQPLRFGRHGRGQRVANCDRRIENVLHSSSWSSDWMVSSSMTPWIARKGLTEEQIKVINRVFHFGPGMFWRAAKGKAWLQLPPEFAQGELDFEN